MDRRRPNPTPFGILLRERRTLAGMSQRDLAKALGVSHVTIGEVERGKRRSLHCSHWPTIERVLRHTAGRVTGDELLRCDAASHPITLSPETAAELAALLESIRTDKPTTRAWMLDVIGHAQRIEEMLAVEPAP